MTMPSRALLLLVALLATACAHTTATIRYVYLPAPPEGRVTRWIDGDTCEISVELGEGKPWREKVRLFGIDTPELKEPGGYDARDESIERWPLGSDVSLTYPKRRRDGRVVYRDNFGRLLATLNIVR